ncbi:hypothetical protein SUGI_0173670 [Cryptomeria japonica]|nr:hypothetical protein SUGI_0173670 [Cryptomeria japonica]
MSKASLKVQISVLSGYPTSCKNIICPKKNLPYMSIAVSQTLIAYKSTLENSAMLISSKEKTTLAAPLLHKQVIPNKGHILRHWRLT